MMRNVTLQITRDEHGIIQACYIAPSAEACYARMSPLGDVGAKDDLRDLFARIDAIIEEASKPLIIPTGEFIGVDEAAKVLLHETGYSKWEVATEKDDGISDQERIDNTVEALRAFHCIDVSPPCKLEVKEWHRETNDRSQLWSILIASFPGGIFHETSSGRISGEMRLARTIEEAVQALKFWR